MNAGGEEQFMWFDSALYQIVADILLMIIIFMANFPIGSSTKMSTLYLTTGIHN